MAKYTKKEKYKTYRTDLGMIVIHESGRVSLIPMNEDKSDLDFDGEQLAEMVGCDCDYITYNDEQYTEEVIDDLDMNEVKPEIEELKVKRSFDLDGATNEAHVDPMFEKPLGLPFDWYDIKLDYPLTEPFETSFLLSPTNTLNDIMELIQYQYLHMIPGNLFWGHEPGSLFFEEIEIDPINKTLVLHMGS